MIEEKHFRQWKLEGIVSNTAGIQGINQEIEIEYE